MPQKKKILVVDDEPDHCAVVKRILEQSGFDVVVAYDGKECLEKVKADPPDAIVLDVVMPETDGLTVCRTLKADQAYCRIPIMILTAESATHLTRRFSRDRELYANADDYLLKPASAEQITRGLWALLQR
ncbi:MAG: response regulator [Desulfatitalea sp.]|nr:response regulator [Desulfatitalea sp.]NNJ99782.1 response regulator [Desulfatitalea sp.]